MTKVGGHRQLTTDNRQPIIPDFTLILPRQTGDRYWRSLQEMRKDIFTMIATTQFGLEEVLAQELTQLGAQDVKVSTRAVEFAGDQGLLYRANIWCRTAIRIL